MAKKYTIEDTPKFSPWPSRLLGLENFDKREKTPAEIIREFHVEKWGSLLDRFNQHNSGVSLQEVDRWFRGSTVESLCWIRNGFKLLNFDASAKYYVQLIEKEVAKYLPAPCIVELGCGYGSIILKLAKRKIFSSSQFKAAEYTEAGRILTKKIADFEKYPLEVGWCDFASNKITDLDIPSGSIIFTSFAAFYIKQFKSSFAEAISSLKPKAVIHFEPLFEDCLDGNLLSLMRKKYIELNDYNLNLLTMLKQVEDIGRIKILNRTLPIFGENPFLACSIVTWQPLFE